MEIIRELLELAGRGVRVYLTPDGEKYIREALETSEDEIEKPA